MTPADKRAALARARELVIGGSPLLEASRAVGLSLDVIKRASTKGKWIAEREAAHPDLVPLTLGRDPTEATIAEQAQALIREAITSGRPVKVADAILIERWAAERERERESGAGHADYSGVDDEILDAADRALAALERAAAGGEPDPGDYTHSPLDLARRRIAALEQDLALPLDVEAIADERDQALADRDGARAALAAVTAERDEARATLDRIAGDAAIARWSAEPETA